MNRASTSDYIDAELDLYYQNPNRPSTQSVSNMSKVTWLMMQAREGNMTEAEALAEIDKITEYKRFEAGGEILLPQSAQPSA